MTTAGYLKASLESPLSVVASLVVEPSSPVYAACGGVGHPACAYLRRCIYSHIGRPYEAPTRLAVDAVGGPFRTTKELSTRRDGPHPFIRKQHAHRGEG